MCIYIYTYLCKCLILFQNNGLEYWTQLQQRLTCIGHPRDSLFFFPPLKSTHNGLMVHFGAQNPLESSFSFSRNCSVTNTQILQIIYSFYFSSFGFSGTKGTLTNSILSIVDHNHSTVDFGRQQVIVITTQSSTLILF